MTLQDQVELQNWQQAAQTAADALHVFSAWLAAWECHPMVGQLPADLFDAVIADLHRAGLESWADPARLETLKRIICGNIAESTQPNNPKYGNIAESTRPNCTFGGEL